ncbi:cilia- and flagella-associated protein 97 isoform X1, partial [Silurus meridionalis]
MYSPKELEGEVDHSFFDSDCDASEAQSEKPVHREKEDRDGTDEKFPDQSECSQIEKKVERHEELEKEKPGLEDQSSLDLKGGSDPKGQSRFKMADIFERKKKTEEETEDGKTSPLSHSDMSGSDLSDDSSRVSSEDDDDIHKNEDDDQRRQRNRAKKSGRKLFGFLRRHSSSSSSRERSPTPPGQDPADQKQRRQTSERIESDDTVTDVTPLSSPDVSPQQAFDLAPTTSTDPTLHVPPADTLDTAHEQHLVANTDDKKSVVLSMSRQMDSVLLVSSPVGSRRTVGSGQRKNYSFTSAEVRRIERENHRLLHELSRSSACFSSHAARRSSAPSSRLYHSGLNRMRDQERIQRENTVSIRFL